MLLKIPKAEIAEVVAAVNKRHGPTFVYHHTVFGTGPDGERGRVDVFSNEDSNWDNMRTVHVLNGNVLEPF